LIRTFAVTAPVQAKKLIGDRSSQCPGGGRLVVDLWPEARDLAKAAVERMANERSAKAVDREALPKWLLGNGSANPLVVNVCRAHLRA
jgi:hypothetical protein